MKLTSLRLEAFGAFSETTLELPLGQPLQVIYGANEAGKSTALRAIHALLFGFPGVSRDAFLHPLPKLRVGGTLLFEDGESLSVTRRRGRKNTLSGLDGAAFDERLLTRRLGASEAVFGSLFGLSHETLRQGAESLLAEGGQVAGVLYGAGAAGRSVRAVLDSLRSEADALFRPRGEKPRLNKGLRDYKAAKKRVETLQRAPRAWATQHSELERLRAERQRLEATRKDRLEERSRLERLKRVLPLAAQRAELLRQRGALGDVPFLAEDAAERRERTQAQQLEAHREAELLQEDLSRLQGRREAMGPPDSIADVASGLMEQVEERVAAYRGQDQRIATCKVEQTRLQENLHAIGLALLPGSGEGGSGSTVGSVEVGSALRAAAMASAKHQRLRELSTRWVSLRDAEQSLEKRLADLRIEQEAIEREKREMDIPAWGARIEAALERARAVAGLDERIEEAAQTVHRSSEEVTRAAAQLGLADVSVDAIGALSVPSKQAAAEVAGRLADAERAFEALVDRTSQLQGRLCDVDRALDAMGRTGEIPDESALGEAREQRDAVWRDLCRAYEEGEGLAGHFQRFQQCLDKADELADRLRREAGRVAEHASLVTERRSLEQTLAHVAAERTEGQAALKALGKEWEALWKSVGRAAGTPAAMQEWLAEFVALRAAIAKLGEERRSLAALEASRKAVRTELAEALDDQNCDVRTGSTGLSPLLEQACVYQKRAESEIRALGRVDERLGDVRRRISHCQQEMESLEQERSLWRTQWAAALAFVGLSGDFDPAEAEVLLGGLAQLRQGFEALDDRAVRLREFEVEFDWLRERATELAARYAPAMLGDPPDLVLTALAARYRDAIQKRERAVELDEQVSEKRAALDHALRIEKEAESALREMMRKAGVEDVGLLSIVERSALDARRLDMAIAQVERQMAVEGEGVPLASLLREAEKVDPEQVRGRLIPLDEELEDLQAEGERVAQLIGGVERGLALYDARFDAAEAEEDAQALAASISADLERYVQARLGACVLERAAEHYRKKHQAPVLDRASAYFSELTAGRYCEILVELGDDDQPVIQCVRKEGGRLGVHDLSDGTRDQVYLALRLATIERHIDASEALPLVLDDAFVHFDDARAAAAFGVLARLPQRLQVLFFTHHRKLVELSREVVPPDSIAFHELAVARPA